MADQVAPLRLGTPIRFRDRWEGHLAAFEAAPDWEVLNLVARRGVLWSSSVKLPFASSSDWSGEQVAFDCTSEEAFGRRLPPVAAPGRALSGKTSLAAAGARLVGALVSRSDRRVTHLLIRYGALPAQEYKAAVDQVGFEAGVLRLAVQVDSGAVVIEGPAASFKELARLCLLIGGGQSGDEGFELQPGVHVTNGSPTLRLRTQD